MWIKSRGSSRHKEVMQRKPGVACMAGVDRENQQGIHMQPAVMLWSV